MAKCTDCIHHFVCETLKGKLEDTWAETCVAYKHRENFVGVVRSVAVDPPVDYRAGYNFIMALQRELASKHHNELGLLDYTSVKALAATYELQDYLANRIAKAVAEGELDPDPEE